MMKSDERFLVVMVAFYPLDRGMWSLFARKTAAEALEHDRRYGFAWVTANQD
jgi:hypothetical protein